MTAKCRSCPAPIEWAKTMPALKPIPLDPDPVDPATRGALVRVGGFAYGPTDLINRLAEKEGVSTARAAELIEERYEYRLSHFATCPNASQHRRGR